MNKHDIYAAEMAEKLRLEEYERAKKLCKEDTFMQRAALAAYAVIVVYSPIIFLFFEALFK